MTPFLMVEDFLAAALLTAAALALARALPVRVLVSTEDELVLVLVAALEACEPDDVIVPEDDPLIDPEADDEPDTTEELEEVALPRRNTERARRQPPRPWPPRSTASPEILT